MSDLGFAACKQPASKWTETTPAPWAARDAERPAHALRREVRYNRLLFALQSAIVDIVAIFSAFTLSDFAYNLVVHGAYRSMFDNAQLGILAAALFVSFNLYRHSYALSDYLDLSGHAERIFSLWNYSFLAAATAGFMLRAIGDSSRGAFIVFYFVGLGALYASRAALVVLTKRHADAGNVLTARVMIVGAAAGIDEFLNKHALAKRGMEIVSVCAIGQSVSLDAQLAEAAETARRLMPDDVILVIPLEQSTLVERCITAFMRVPAAIHLHLDRNNPLHRFSGPQFGGDAAISSFRLPADSMSAVGAAAKRACDIVLSLVALIVLAPLFAFVAIAIKVDSPGPVLYFQARHGFNKKRFRIVKFRSMRATEEGAAVKQAVANDPRITRVGRWLRRFNIDELPQILNVLRGEMSLVGPRPHALVHDMAFETEISLYARRHNVKPGITGWAQVNGLRGETDTPEKISRRVHYDLHYIDNWSLVFDIWIMCLTLFSRKAYSNAR
ncbi:MAG: exopolysaccharide biosynthesis polyprenyl glycosylphosphotransferase [Rhodoblastus sp.]